MASKRILVTGGNKGIGFAVCAKLLDQYPETFVLLGSRDAKKGQDAIKSLEESKASRKGRVSFVQVDVADKDSVEAAARSVAATYAKDQPYPLYGIMNNAGVAHGTASELFQTNVHGAKFVVDSFLPLLDPDAGRIVNISSGAATMFVSACAPEATKKLFTNPSITWEKICQLLDTVRVLVD
jgi:NAD(P)-dependent dehydrogenase (short-subunit alcohol dehydrogenase family)